MMTRTPAPDQQDRDRAILARAVNVIADAGAGTGKTTLLVARLVQLVAPEDDGVALPLGRVAAIRSHTFWNSVVNCFVPLAWLRRIPSAIPIAAATPMAGAPRITIVRMALATSCAVLHVT